QRDSSILQQLSLVDRLNFTIAIANRLLAKPEYAQQSVRLASAELNQNNEHRLIKTVFLDIWFVASKQEVEALEARTDLLGEKFARYSQIRSEWSPKDAQYFRRICIIHAARFAQWRKMVYGVVKRKGFSMWSRAT
ncbi:MAG: hypothetical protein AAF558_13445, partial [Verrucomicrobiota bacterium]